MDRLRFVLDNPATPATVERRRRRQTTGVHYDTEWANSDVSRFVRRVGVWAFMKPAIAIYGSPKVIGVDRLRDVDGPVIFAANHHSHADTTLLLATIPAHLREDLVIAAGADYFFPNRVVGAISALFIGAIPIERKRLSKLSVDNTVGAVEDGRNLLIFPEGGRSPDGWGRQHRPGAAFVSKQTGAPVVPVYIDGTGKILPKGQSWPTRSSCAVVFGAPITIDDDGDARRIALRIQRSIDELADQLARGWWEARKNAHRGTTPEISGPAVGAWRRRWALGPGPGQARPAATRHWPRF
jgi:1-acyl-sn-glycerol-3-phosphate acyltransferase